MTMSEELVRFRIVVPSRRVVQRPAAEWRVIVDALTPHVEDVHQTWVKWVDPVSGEWVFTGRGDPKAVTLLTALAQGHNVEPLLLACLDSTPSP